MTFRNRLARRAGWALGLALVAPMALAQTAAAPAVEGKRVAIDPATGQVRPYESDDGTAGPAAAATGTAAAPAARAAAPATGLMSRLKGGDVVSATGARGVRLTPEHLNYTRITRLPDGSLSMTCTVGESAEEHARHTAAALRAQQAAGKGAADVE